MGNVAVRLYRDLASKDTRLCWEAALQGYSSTLDCTLANDTLQSQCADERACERVSQLRAMYKLEVVVARDGVDLEVR